MELMNSSALDAAAAINVAPTSVINDKGVYSDVHYSLRRKSEKDKLTHVVIHIKS